MEPKTKSMLMEGEDKSKVQVESIVVKDIWRYKWSPKQEVGWFEEVEKKKVKVKVGDQMEPNTKFMLMEGSIEREVWQQRT